MSYMSVTCDQMSALASWPGGRPNPPAASLHARTGKRQREVTAMRKIVTVAAGLAVAAGAFLGGYVAHAPASGPRACAAPALPPGDAMQAGGREYVCTDGTWVRVTRYGSGS